MYCPEVPGMPLVGLGVWKCPGDVASDVVYNALDLGYRHLDCACDYGNERQVGEAIKKAVDDGICTREEIWVTSKLWNTYHRREHVPLACQRTLEDLGLDYVDLYLIHFPISLPFVPFEQTYPPEWTDTPGNTGTMRIDPVPYRETWEAMEELQMAGKAKTIGMCNVTVPMLMDVLSYCRVKPAMLQIELHPYLVQSSLVACCKEYGIGVTAFSPLAGTSYPGTDASENVLQEAAICEIAEAHGKTPAQVCLRFQLDRGVVAIPKSQNPDRLRENLDVFDFNLSGEEMERIASLNRNRRFNDPGVFCKNWGLKNGCPIYC